MQWVSLAVLIGLVLAVATGRVPVIWVVYVLSVIFILMALALAFAYWRTKQHGLLLMGLAYGASAVLAIVIADWWPLAAGFAIVWGLRAMGLDPSPQAAPPAQTQAIPPESDNKS